MIVRKPHIKSTVNYGDIPVSSAEKLNELSKKKFLSKSWMMEEMVKVCSVRVDKYIYHIFPSN